MSVFLFSADVKTQNNQQTAIRFLMKSDSIHSFDLDKERNLLTIITNGNVQPMQVEEWLQEEGFECKFIRI